MPSGRKSFRGRFTGKHPTKAEWAEMVDRARQLIDNWQYTAPEQLEWAMTVDPEYAEEKCGTFAGGK